ncbi:MAG: PmoA family protein [Candidatus Latescibacteria bacterium]|nr:PmoA family protein [Candidatus Latescibacterota bacterium]
MDHKGYFLIVKIDRLEFTRYHYGQEHPKPFLYPVLCETGQSVVTHAPSDHYHHHGIWIAHGDVNGHNLWTSTHGGEGRMRHREFLTAEAGETATIRAITDWLDPAGCKLCEDERMLIFLLDTDGSRIIDIACVVKATEGDVVLGRTKEAGIPHVRVSDRIDVNHGGRIENSEGQVNEEATFGQRARWVDYSGPVSKNDWAGVAFFDHPSNPEYPAPWFTRNYGPFSPNFIFFTGAYTITHGSSLALRHRVVVHQGDAKTADVEGKYARYLSSFPAGS